VGCATNEEGVKNADKKIVWGEGIKTLKRFQKVSNNF